MGAGGSVALPEGDAVTLDEAKAYAGEGGWNEDAQKAFDAAAADGKVTKDAISAYEAEQNKAATKLQASIRGQQERKNPTKPPEKSGDAPAEGGDAPAEGGDAPAADAPAEGGDAAPAEPAADAAPAEGGDAAPAEPAADAPAEGGDAPAADAPAAE